MLYILSNTTNEMQDIEKFPKPEKVVYVVFSNKPKNKSIINTYRQYCKKNDVQFHVCYVVGENFEPTISSLNGLGTMYHKGTILPL